MDLGTHRYSDPRHYRRECPYSWEIQTQVLRSEIQNVYTLFSGIKQENVCVCVVFVCVSVCTERGGERENRCGAVLAAGALKWRERGHSRSCRASVSGPGPWELGAAGAGCRGARGRTPVLSSAVCPVCSSPPIHMKVQPLDQSTLQVAWSQPETIYHPPIMSYMVSYSWTKNEDEKEKTFTKDSDKDLVRPRCSESGRPRRGGPVCLLGCFLCDLPAPCRRPGEGGHHRRHHCDTTAPLPLNLPATPPEKVLICLQLGPSKLTAFSFVI